MFINGYFEDGHAIGFHADDEPDIEPGSTIASVSLGAERDMVFKKKDNSLDLNFLSGTADLKKYVFINLRKQVRQKMEGISARQF